MSTSNWGKDRKENGGLKAAIYVRVSTPRQAEKELSITDQRNQAHAYCERKGWHVVASYEDAGLSGTDENRPQLQKLMDDAARPEKPFDVVIVHSFSRFFRDAYQFEFHRRNLVKHDVNLASISQETGDDPMGDMVRQVLNVFDEYQSKENAKHVRRAMIENAKQGFWNGGPPPYGYRTTVAETRGITEKKVLEIEPAEATIVRLVFELCGKNRGVRAIAAELNKSGLRNRNGKNFASTRVHEFLTQTAYAGRFYFNRTDTRNKRPRDPSEWIEIKTPIIIEPDTFDRVQRKLEARRPTNTPPRIVNGPTLLTGILKCGTCGGGMTLRTGKGGRYRYYVCNRSATEGKTACPGRSVRMDKLDKLVIEQLESRILSPDRLSEMLAQLIERNSKQSDQKASEVKALRKEFRVTEEKIGRLYDALASGTVEHTESFRQSVSKFEGMREDLLRRIASVERHRNVPVDLLTPENVKRFGKALGRQLRNPDSTLRKTYTRQFIDRIEARDREIRIYGPKHALAAGVAYGLDRAIEEVPVSVREWWARQDSNLQPDRYERPALTS